MPAEMAGIATVSALTLVHASQFPHLKVVSLSPGFIDTPMTKGFGARLTPEQGCRSSIRCLFEPVTPGRALELSLALHPCPLLGRNGQTTLAC